MNLAKKANLLIFLKRLNAYHLNTASDELITLCMHIFGSLNVYIKKFGAKKTVKGLQLFELHCFTIGF